MTPGGAAGGRTRTALVTGGTGGMGRVIASKLAAPAEEQEQLAALPPLGRLGSPDDIASIVSFLVGPTGRWVNGQVVYANGGLV